MMLGLQCIQTLPLFPGLFRSFFFSKAISFVSPGQRLPDGSSVIQKSTQSLLFLGGRLLALCLIRWLSGSRYSPGFDPEEFES